MRRNEAKSCIAGKSILATSPKKRRETIYEPTSFQATALSYYCPAELHSGTLNRPQWCVLRPWIHDRRYRDRTSHGRRRTRRPAQLLRMARGAGGVSRRDGGVWLAVRLYLRRLREAAQREFGWNREAVSLGFAIAAMTVGLSSPWIGRLIDKVGPRRVILPCITVFGCGIAALSLLRSGLWQFYLTCFGSASSETAQLTWLTRDRSQPGSRSAWEWRWLSSW